MTFELDLHDSWRYYLVTNGIRLLSLDRATPFWADLGLLLPPSDAVREAARRCVRSVIALETSPGDDLDHSS
jgi:hypothetical protein